MELEDCGFEDSDVYLEGGASAIGPVNHSLVPRFEPEESDDTGRSTNRSGKGNKRR